MRASVIADSSLSSCFLKKKPKPGSKVRFRGPGVVIGLWLYLSVFLYHFATSFEIYVLNWTASVSQYSARDFTLFESGREQKENTVLPTTQPRTMNTMVIEMVA